MRGRDFEANDGRANLRLYYLWLAHNARLIATEQWFPDNPYVWTDPFTAGGRDDGYRMTPAYYPNSGEDDAAWWRRQVRRDIELARQQPPVRLP